MDHTHDVLAALGRKLDALDLTAEEHAALLDVLTPNTDEVAGFAATSFGALLPTLGLMGTAGSPDIFKDPGTRIAGTAGSPEIFKDPGTRLAGAAGSPDI